jgi:hypothetical protein
MFSDQRRCNEWITLARLDRLLLGHQVSSSGQRVL